MSTKAGASTISFLYSKVLKHVLFSFEPEDMHNRFVDTGALLASSAFMKRATSAAFDYENRMLEQNVLGMRFRNPVGLSAGFDKDGKAASIMGDVGFGFAEIGSVTASACSGNKGVRLKRLTDKRSLWVHLGLRNEGAESIHKRVKSINFSIPIGVSAAKTNCMETTDPKVGLRDYLFTVRKFRDIASFFDMNISCPNAFGGKDFADPELFGKLAKGLYKMRLRQPVMVKMSPDLSRKNIDEILSIASSNGISGFICTNLTDRHGFGKGGISGKALQKRADALLSYVYRRSRRKGYRFTLIGVGGIFSASDAYRKIRLGANLVELITGMIYEGPQLIGQINRGLVDLLKKDGFSNISEAVGTGIRKA